MKKNRGQKYAMVIAGLVFPSLVMTAAEYMAERQGLELRTWAQGIKGIWIWLVMPSGILYTGSRFLQGEIDRVGGGHTRILQWTRRILAVVFSLVILGLAFFRGVYYVFTEEMVEEERLEDGLLKGKWSAFLSETQTGYYEVVAGIFRRPVPQWNSASLPEEVFEGEILKEAPEGAYSAGENPAGESHQEQNSSQEASGKKVDFMDIWDGHYEKECQVGDGTVRYRMVVEDAALGSRFYGLLKSVDGGRSWQMFNSDPFDQQLGQGIDFTFLDENFGFATLAHNGGKEADLYVTRDGSGCYELVEMEAYTVTLDDGFTCEPYDYPQMPWEEDGAVWVLCGQGADGDYNGGDEAGLALYRSTDMGKTFHFVEIRTPQTE